MKPKKEIKKKEKPLTANDILKLEIAEELGLKERVLNFGWDSLTAAETGRIGGIMGAKNKLKKLESTELK